jgi:hypothetical protein
MTFTQAPTKTSRAGLAAGASLTPAPGNISRATPSPSRRRFPSGNLPVALILFLLCVSASLRLEAAQVRNYLLDTTGTLDTNALIITRISTNVLSNGGVIGQGIPIRTPRSPWTNTLALGFYSVSNIYLRAAYVINVDDNTSTLYDATNLLHSGFNTYVVKDVTSNGVVSALGYVPGAATNTAAVTATNLATVTTNGGVVIVNVSTGAVQGVVASMGTLSNNHSSLVVLGGGLDVSGGLNVPSGGASLGGNLTAVGTITTESSFVGNLTGNAATATTATEATSAALLTGNGSINSTNYLGALNLTVTNTQGDPVAVKPTTLTAGTFLRNAGIINASGRGWYGYVFYPTQAVEVTELARWSVAGNTNTHDLIIATRKGHVLGRTTIDLNKAATNGFVYAPLPKPAYLAASNWYSIASYESDQANQDRLYQVSTATLNPHLIFIGGMSHNVFPQPNLPSWPTVGYAVDFKFMPVGTLPFGSAGLGTNYTGGTLIAENLGGPANYINSAYASANTELPLKMMDTTGPTLGWDFFWNWTVFDVPPTLNHMTNHLTIIKDMGMNRYFPGVNPDDGWHMMTNGAGIKPTTYDGQLNFATNTIARDPVTRAAIPDPDRFPGGLAYFANWCRANGFVPNGYLPLRNKPEEVYADAYQWASVGIGYMMMDVSVGGRPYNLAPAALDEQRWLIRSITQGFLDAQANGNTLLFTNRFRPRLSIGLNSYGGTGAPGYYGENTPTNVVISPEALAAANGMIIMGDDTTWPSEAMNKVHRATNYFNLVRPGHCLDLLVINWNSGGSNAWRGRINAYALMAGHVLSSPYYVTNLAPSDVYCFTNAEFYDFYTNPYPTTGQRKYATDGNEIWVRNIATNDVLNLTNYVAVYNAGPVATNLTITAAMLGFPSNSPIVLRDPWFKTNITFTGAHTVTVPPTNVDCYFASYRSPADYVSEWEFVPAPSLNASGTGTGLLTVNSPTVAPHFYAMGWQQPSTVNAFYVGYAVEPNVTNLTVRYSWTSSETAPGIVVYWTDTWSVLPAGDTGRGAGVNYTTNIFCQSNYTTSVEISLPMGTTNAWKQVNLTAGAGTNANSRFLRHGFYVKKDRSR